MSIIAIEVKAECDRCGLCFVVEMDPSEVCCKDREVHDSELTIFDKAVEAITEGHEKGDILAPTSMQGSEMLCSECTEKADEIEVE